MDFGFVACTLKGIYSIICNENFKDILKNWLVGCGLTSLSAILQLYSDGTVVQFSKF